MIKIFVFLSIFTVVFGVYPQYAKLHKDGQRCFGQNYLYTFDTKENLTEPWSNVLSVQFRGAWIWSYSHISRPDQKIHSLEVDGSGGFCMSLSEDYSVSSVTKLLDVDLETSAISLIPYVTNISSVINIYTSEHRFASPKSIQNIVITGIDDYMIYEGVNYDGPSFCAIARHYDEHFGVTNVYNPLGYFWVGSLRLGHCSCGQKNKQYAKHEQAKNNIIQEERRTITANSGMKVTVPVNWETYFSIPTKPI